MHSWQGDNVGGFGSSSADDPGIRAFWMDHARRCRTIGAQISCAVSRQKAVCLNAGINRVWPPGLSVSAPPKKPSFLHCSNPPSNSAKPKPTASSPHVWPCSKKPSPTRGALSGTSSPAATTCRPAPHGCPKAECYVETTVRARGEAGAQENRTAGPVAVARKKFAKLQKNYGERRRFT